MERGIDGWRLSRVVCEWQGYMQLNSKADRVAAPLDGGIEQWLAEDRPVSGETTRFSTATFIPHVHENFRARLDEVKTTLMRRPAKSQSKIIKCRREQAA